MTMTVITCAADLGDVSALCSWISAGVGGYKEARETQIKV